jgi:hypothetical protein
MLPAVVARSEWVRETREFRLLSPPKNEVIVNAAETPSGDRRWRFAPDRVRDTSAPPMYLVTRKRKPRKTNRKRSVRYRAKVKAKNRRRRKGLQK